MRRIVDNDTDDENDASAVVAPSLAPSALPTGGRLEELEIDNNYPQAKVQEMILFFESIDSSDFDNDRKAALLIQYLSDPFQLCTSGFKAYENLYTL